MPRDEAINVPALLPTLQLPLNQPPFLEYKYKLTDFSAKIPSRDQRALLLQIKCCD